MFLFSRRGRLNSAAGLEWAIEIAGQAQEASGNAVQLWANTLSPAFGTVTWTSWWADLTSLEAGLANLQAHAGYGALAADGVAHVDGGVDDTLFQTVTGEPNADAVNQYVNGVQASCAAGNLARGMTAGIEIAEKAEAITGEPTMFVRSMTGPYGGVGWLTGFADLGAYETAMAKMAADPGWLTFLDSTEGCFADDVAITQSTLYAKVV